MTTNFGPSHHKSYLPSSDSRPSIHEFPGVVNFFHRFVFHCAGHLHTLHNPLASSKYSWSPECQEAFEFCKSALVKATLLVHPQHNALTCIISEASDQAVGAVLEHFIHSYCLLLMQTSTFRRRLDTARLTESYWAFTLHYVTLLQQL